MPLPEVRLGQPEMKEKYDCYDIDGVKVFIKKGFEAKDGSIIIRLTGILGLKGFDVSGFKAL